MLFSQLVGAIGHLLFLAVWLVFAFLLGDGIRIFRIRLRALASFIFNLQFARGQASRPGRLTRLSDAGRRLLDRRNGMSPIQAVAVLLLVVLPMPQAELAQAFSRPNLTVAPIARPVSGLSSPLVSAPPAATQAAPRRGPASAPGTAARPAVAAVPLASAVVEPTGLHGAAMATGSAISPNRLGLSTYLGGAGSELMRDFAGYPNLDAAIDSQGNIYVVGGTSSPDFPTTPNALRRQLAGRSDIFLVKLDPTGQEVLYATLLGGSGDESAAAVAVGANGAIYLAGTTTSADFPSSSSFSAGWRAQENPDAFVLKLEPTARTVVWGACLGGSAPDSARDLVVDDTGAATVVGLTASVDFPTTPGAFQRASAGGTEAFAVRLSPSGSALTYSTYVGGAGDDRALGLLLDDGGATYIAGRTDSTDFATTTGAYRTTPYGGADGFVARLGSSGADLEAATFLGGEGDDAAAALTRDGLGRISVACVSAAGPGPACGVNVVVKRLSADLSTLEASTRLGDGGPPDFLPALAADPWGNLLLTGSGAGFAPGNAILTKLDSTGHVLDVTNLGGSGIEGALALAVDPQGVPWVAGVTASPDFPLAQAWQPAYGGGAFDAFVWRIDDLLGTRAAAISIARPTLNGGRIEGDLRVEEGQSWNINSDFQMTGDLFVVGTPEIRLNGGSSHGGVVDDAGAVEPSNYRITLHNVALPGLIHRRSDALPLPADTASAPEPTGTRHVNINRPADLDTIGDWTTVRRLQVNGVDTVIEPPPGHYESFKLNGPARLRFHGGEYTFSDGITLNAQSSIEVVGETTILLGDTLTINSGGRLVAAAGTRPGRIRIHVFGKHLNLDADTEIQGLLHAPSANVIMNARSTLRGQLTAGSLALNAGAVILADTAASDPPEASGDATTTEEDTPVTIDVLGNDSDPDGDSFAIADFTQPAHGAVTCAAGALVYTPAADYNGLDSFIYTVLDEYGDSTTATVTVTVSPVNDPPAAAADTASTDEDKAVTIDVLANDSDPDGDSIAIAELSQPAHGAVTSGTGGALVYTPATDYQGTDSFTYKIADGHGEEATATVTITVSPVNDPPTVNAGPDQVLEWPADTAALVGTVLDDEPLPGHPPVYLWQKATGPGEVVFADPAAPATVVRFTQPGVYDLRLTVDDSQFQASDLVSVTVHPANLPPSVQAGPDRVLELPGNSLTLEGSVSDDGLPLGSVLSLAWSLVQGPAAVNFSNPGAASTGVVFSEPGTYVLRLTAADGQFENADETVVTVAPTNRPPSFVSTPVTRHVLGSGGDQSWTRRLSSWEVTHFPTADVSNAVWKIDPVTDTVRQDVNSAPSALVLDRVFTDGTIRFRLQNLYDNDYMGFVVGWQNAQRFYVFQWKGATETSALRGMAVKAIDSSTPVGAGDFWATQGNGARVRTLWTKDVYRYQWNYDFEVTFRPDGFSFKVIDPFKQAVAEATIVDAAFTPGRFGLFCYAQPDIKFSPVTHTPPGGSAESLPFSRWQNAALSSIPPLGSGPWIVNPETDSTSYGLCDLPMVLAADRTAANTNLVMPFRVTDPNPIGAGCVGLTFAYRDPRHFYLFQWQRADWSYGSYRGMTVKAVSSDSLVDEVKLRPTAGVPGAVRTLYSNNVVWQPNVDYVVVIGLTAGKIGLAVYQGNLLLAQTFIDEPELPTGSYGFFDMRQRDVQFEPIVVEPLQSVYVYDADAVDPDGDDVTYAVDAGPTGLSIDFGTGLVTWPASSADIGTHPITLRANDTTGRSGIQEYQLEVVAGPPPMVDAGSDQLVPLLARATLSATAEMSNRCAIPAWSVVSGPGPYRIEKPGQFETSAWFHAVGEYVLRLTVTYLTETVTDEVHITVRPLPDLAVTSVDVSGLAYDPQSLQVAGQATALIQNLGEWSMQSPFSVIFFADGNADGLFDEGVDSILAEIEQLPLAAGASATVSASISGTVLFQGQAIHVFADAGNAIPESREANNYGVSSPICTTRPAGPFTPQLEWSWENVAGTTGSPGVMGTPLVIDLDRDGQPEVVFVASEETAYKSGVLYAVDGRDGTQVFAATDPASALWAGGALAAGDIDGDGFPEIVAAIFANDQQVLGGGIISVNKVVAFEHDGTRKWTSPQLNETIRGALSIADLDRDGVPEIIAGRIALNANGTVKWTGTGGCGRNLQTNLHFGPVSIVADVDMDGWPEVLAGNTVYRRNGTILWQNQSLTDGYNAIANFDDEPLPEIVLVSQGKVWLLEHNGVIKWGPVTIPGGGIGGPPTVADFDGDGLPEIGVAAYSRYCVFEHDGQLKWAAAVQDYSSATTGSSVFDFEGDGQAEVVYADERYVRVYNGATGEVLAQIPMGSATNIEYPVITDVDADGHAEIVAVANIFGTNTTRKGVYVYGNPTWSSSRRIWNQHSYHITNVSATGAVPAREPNSWERHNNFRQNTMPRLCAFGGPDLVPSRFLAEPQGDGWLISGRVGNRGTHAAPQGVPVSLYHGDPRGDGRLVATVHTSKAIGPDQYADVVYAAPAGTVAAPLWVSVNDAGGLIGPVDELDQENNLLNTHLFVGAEGSQLRLTAQATPSVIMLPESSVALAGTVSFDEGGPTGDVTTLWSQVEGPAPAGIADPASPNTTANFSVAGDYTFRLEARDEVYVVSATTTVQVYPANQPPQVDAGPGQVLYGETGAGTALDGTVTDDGLPVGNALTFQWSKIAGPSYEVVFDDAHALDTGVTFGGPGVYVLELSASDGLASAADTVIIEVRLPVPNQAPAVTIQGPAEIVLPAEAELVGAAVDDGLPAGGSLSYLWSQVDGPGLVTFAAPQAAGTTAAFSLAGTYTLRLAVSDSELSGWADASIVVHPAPVNQAPVVSAGAEQIVEFEPDLVTNGGNEEELVEGEIPGWTETSGTGWTQATPGSSGGDVVLPLSAAGMTYFWAGAEAGAEASAELTQEIDVSAYAATVDRGDQQFAFSVHFQTGQETTPDLAYIIWEFQDGAGGSLGRLDSGPLSSPGAWSTAEETFPMPAGARLVRVRLLAERHSGQTADVYFDNVVLRPVGAAGVILSGSVTDDGLPATSTVSALWEQIEGPTSAVFEDATQAVTAVTLGAPGAYAFRLTGSDGALSASEETGVTVAAANKPPVVDAGPDLSVEINAAVQLGGAVSDDGLPNGSAVQASWSVVSGPGGMAFVDATSPATAATFGAIGVYTLLLCANDSLLVACDTALVTVRDVNRPPSVSASGPADVVVLPASATLSGTANDDGYPSGGLGYTWSQVSGPGTATFGAASGSGPGGSPGAPRSLTASTSVSFPTAGTYVLRWTATDGELSASVDVTVQVAQPPNTPPTVEASSDVSWVRMPETATLGASVSDDGVPYGGTLSVAWSLVEGPAPVAFSDPAGALTTVAFSERGLYTIRLTASDGELSASDDLQITVYNPITGPPPTVSLLSPEDGGIVTARTDVAGSVSDGDWTLSYTPDTETPLDPEHLGMGTIIGRGSGPVPDGLLGLFDPTLLVNGIYRLILSSTDASGQTAWTERAVTVDGNLKIGHFTVSFEDLAVPVVGLPIRVIRTYDSRDPRPGDFGAGWTLDVKNARLLKSGVLGLDWAATVSGPAQLPTHCLEPARKHLVTVVFPQGKVHRFLARTVKLGTSSNCQLGAPLSAARVVYEPMEGTYGSLESVSGDEVLVLADGFPGPARLMDYNAGVYNPTVFRFSTPEGMVYRIVQGVGVTEYSDPNGNRVTIGPNGITHSAGKSITFERDAEHRITRLTDPEGNAIEYGYTGGDLSTVTDREGNTTRFEYNDDHCLLKILDPLNRPAVRNEYDASGRILGHTDAAGNRISYTHDLDANLEIITDRLGHQTRLEYDNRGNVVRSVDALGNATRRTYDAHDNLLTETNPLGHTTTYEYDAADNRTAVINPLGHTTQYTYNSRRQVLTTTDPLGHVTTNAYDSNGNLTSTVDPLGNVTSFVNNSAGLPTSVTRSSADGTQSIVTRYEYDPAGHLTREIDPLGHATSYTYDTNGNRLTKTVTRTSPPGAENLVTGYEYDSENRLRRTVFPDGSSTEADYNGIGKLNTVTDQLGRQTTVEYSTLGMVSRVSYPDLTEEKLTFDAEGRLVESTNRGGRKLSIAYDATGRLVSTVLPDNSTAGIDYDADGRVTSSTDANGHLTRHEYDAAGRQIAVVDALGHRIEFAYDEAGNLISRTDARGQVVAYECDQRGQRTRELYPDGTTRQFGYDFLGRLITIVDQAGKTTRRIYDANGRLVQLVDALGQVTAYGYNELGNLLTQTDANGHTSRFEYDRMGRRTKRVLPMGQTETYTTNAVGRLTAKTDFNGRTTAYAYDAANRLLRVTPDPSFGAAPITYTYTADGWRARMIDGAGTTEYSYDPVGRLLTRQTPFGTLSYGYDPAGNLLGVRSSNANGVAVDYTYDAVNRLTRVSDLQLPNGETLYGYDAAGNLMSLGYPNGVGHQYVYNALNRLTDLDVSRALAGRSPEVQATYRYTLGPAGNRLSVAELGGRAVNYSYDDLYRLTAESITGDSGGCNGRIDYSYDPVGNRLSTTSTLPGVPSAVYSFDANDRLTSDLYDENGNTITASAGLGGGTPSGFQDSYDFENRLIRRVGLGVDISIQYDGDGNRVAKTVNGLTTRYLVDTNNLTGYAQVVEEIRDGAVQRAYTYGLALIAQRQIAGSTSLVSFYGYDGHGSVRQLTDPSGLVTDTYDYDAFGVLIHRTGVTPNLRLYCGEEFDPDLGLYYLRARYMNPPTGRFWSMDAYEGHIFDPASLHKYLYANANPVNRIDPSGHFALAQMATAETIEKALAAASIGVLSGGVLKGVINRLRGEGTFAEGFAEGCNEAFWPVLAGTALALFSPVAAAAVGTYLALVGLIFGIQRTIDDVDAGEDWWVIGFDVFVTLLSAVGVILLMRGAPNGRTAAGPSGLRPPKGGTYILRDPVTGQVMRTGRTNDLSRRAAEHARNPATSDLVFEPVHRTDVYREQRGLEQLLHEQYQPPLNKLNPISPSNSNRPTYLNAAQGFLQGGN